MKLIYTMCVAFVCILISNKSFAQNEEFRHCDTDVMWQKALKDDPSLADKAKQSLDFFRQYAGEDQNIETTLSVPYVIPTVFHVIHDYGIENISKAQILDAMNILNQSFQKLNDDTGDVIPLFQPIFADCQIEFRLATLDPSGNCTDGINRMQSDLTFVADDDVKSLIDWPSNKYLNIWVVYNIGSGAAGYSYYPGISSSVDGIVIRHDYVGGIGTSNGSNYTERSLTHEVGHWLNLPHTWGSSNTPGLPSNCFIDDGVFDTPNTAGTNNFSCNVNQNTCGFIDNVQNYMDYAGCHKMFTNGQKAKMHAALNSGVGQRNNLHTPSTLTSTGTSDGSIGAVCMPVADITSKKILVCSGAIVNFKDYSWGSDITGWQWTFNGGSPSSSTNANPSIQYNTPGIYDVTLEVSNSAGANVITRTALVQVLPDTGIPAVPLTEDFETLSLTGSDWTIENANNNNAWNITSAAGATGVKSMRLVNQTGNNLSTDAFITPVLDFSGASGITMTFSLAFARMNSGDASNLKVSASNNCGQSWIIRYNRTGSALETAPLTTGSFVPTATQWRTESVSLLSSSISGKPSIRLKFEYINDQGNNIYIDNINITSNITSSGQIEGLSEFNLFPNPASGGFTQLQFSLEKMQEISYSVKDITGRDLVLGSGKYSAGDHQIQLNTGTVPGIYILSLNAGNSFITEKIIVQ